MSGVISKLFKDIFVFGDTLRNGVFLTVGDLNGDGFADLISGGGPGGGPRVLALSGKDLLAGNTTVLADFFAGDPDSRNGIRVGTADLDGDGKADLVVGAGQFTGARVVVYLGKDITRTGTPPTTDEFDAFRVGSESAFSGGVFVG